MIIEVLCEDKSSVPVLQSLIPQIAAGYQEIIEKIHIYPHRGKGKWPENLKERPKPFASSLLDVLPAKLRAYDQVYQRQEILLVIVLDADDQDQSEIYQNLEYIIRSEAGNKFFVIGIPVEETEAWLLGDPEAVLAAYPAADQKVLEAYPQDAVCHTWEFLARAVLRDRAERLIKAGYPAVGIYKNRWAEAIAPHLQAARNHSPSFQDYRERLLKVLSWIKEETAAL